jgi:hypothetical protein
MDNIDFNILDTPYLPVFTNDGMVLDKTDPNKKITFAEYRNIYGCAGSINGILYNTKEERQAIILKLARERQDAIVKQLVEVQPMPAPTKENIIALGVDDEWRHKEQK